MFIKDMNGYITAVNKMLRKWPRQCIEDYNPSYNYYAVLLNDDTIQVRTQRKTEIQLEFDF